MDVAKYGKVTLHNVGDRNSFIFSVNDEFLDKYDDSRPDKVHPKLSKVEAVLLTKLLEDKMFCINEKGKVSFKINARQEKIFDMTFAHLIEQNYRAKPLTPRMYFGECVAEVE